MHHDEIMQQAHEWKHMLYTVFVQMHTQHLLYWPHWPSSTASAEGLMEITRDSLVLVRHIQIK